MRSERRSSRAPGGCRPAPRVRVRVHTRGERAAAALLLSLPSRVPPISLPVFNRNAPPKQRVRAVKPPRQRASAHPLQTHTRTHETPSTLSLWHSGFSCSATPQLRGALEVGQAGGRIDGVLDAWELWSVCRLGATKFKRGAHARSQNQADSRGETTGAVRCMRGQARVVLCAQRHTAAARSDTCVRTHARTHVLARTLSRPASAPSRPACVGACVRV